jgi:transcriptional regulator with XRE-family HTH domain
MTLKDLILRSGFRQSYVAERMQLTPAQMSWIITGRRALSAQHAGMLAAILQVPVETVVDAARHTPARSRGRMVSAA